MKELIGTWHLLSCTIIYDDGREEDYWGENPKGVLIYDNEGTVAAQLGKRGRTLFAQNDWSKGTFEELKDAFQTYQAYYGTYELHADEGYVIHHVNGAIFPNWEGKPEKRFFEIDGNKLHITAPPIEVQGGSFVFKLSWEKRLNP